MAPIVRGQGLKVADQLQPHPRILLTEDLKRRVKASCEAEDCWQELDKLVMGTAERLFDEPVTPIYFRGKTMLPQARELFRKVFFLSYAYQFSGDADFAKRGIKEITHAATLESWNPKVFLDVAEMTMAVAIGYDWLYDEMNPSERQLVKDALIKKGIKPSYDNTFNQFLTLDNNWNQVCNAAMVWGAMAIYEDAPQLAAKTIARSLKSSHLPMEKYSKNGVFPEGVMYWTYGTTYHILMLEALAPLLKEPVESFCSEGFMASGQFFLHMIANSGSTFNWSDALEKHYLNPAIFWMAAHTGDPSLLWNEKKVLEQKDFKELRQSRMLPAVLLLGAEFSPGDIPSPSSRSWRGAGENEVVTMRSSWEDPEGIFLGFKLGNASEHHAHMDMGAFVLESDGVRWAMDMGMQDYHSLASKKVDLWDSRQQGGRWTVFRYSNHGHNTLTIDDSLMDVTGKARLLKYSDQKDFRFAVGDLSDVFLRKDRSVTRGVGIKNDDHVIVKDEISASSAPIKIRWKMVTSAKVDTNGNVAILKKDGKEMKLEVKSPKDAEVKVWPASRSNRYDAPNKGASLVGFELSVEKERAETIEVLLIPGSSSMTPMPSQPLSEW
ncbi:hypothetical protein GCM10011339_12500 [Echinicola rosea]|uniref:Heparinase n=1 Tax=Echinicola rosea TaxID=1807691 RepID=A0ABQ1USB6_9BACT|nr:hypothetical protein GCM10011339_12500 [Echinicola rosea]